MDPRADLRRQGPSLPGAPSAHRGAGRYPRWWPWAQRGGVSPKLPLKKQEGRAGAAPARTPGSGKWGGAPQGPSESPAALSGGVSEDGPGLRGQGPPRKPPARRFPPCLAPHPYRSRDTTSRTIARSLRATREVMAPWLPEVSGSLLPSFERLSSHHVLLSRKPLSRPQLG